MTLLLIFSSGFIIGVGLTLLIGYLADKAHPPDTLDERIVEKLAERLYQMEHHNRERNNE